jgi:hypothetical protein
MSTLIALLSLAVLGSPLASQAHSRGLYDSQQDAAQRAQELGCAGTHLNSGKWMPCSNEAELHKYLRHH